MKKSLFSLLWLIMVMVTVLPAREKTEKIGNFTWYTEQNTFADMIRIAQKADKPIFAVFSATWCGPCQHVKKTVFMIDDFKRVSDEVILLYIEQTTREGQTYNTKFKINSFPTFKLFSKDGIMLDTGNVKRSVDGFLGWINGVKAGDSYFELKKKLEKNPKDRESLIRITDKLDYSSRKEGIDYLKKAINVNPDFNDELSHKAYEKLAITLTQNIPYEEKEKTEYLKENQPLFLDIVNAYYPDKFKYGLKEKWGLLNIIGWFNQCKHYEKALSFFTDFIKQKGDQFDCVKDIAIVSNAISSYTGMGNIEEAIRWINKTHDSIKDTEALKKDQEFFYYYSNMLKTVIGYLGAKKEMIEAEKYASLLYDEMSRFDSDASKFLYMEDYAIKYGILTSKAVDYLGEKLKTATGREAVDMTISLAKILAHTGKKEEAAKRLILVYENQDVFKNVKTEMVPDALNSIAWAMVEAKIANPKTLEIAQKAVSLNTASPIMDTLASVHAELGNFKEAVKIEKEALAKTTDNDLAEELKQKIEMWEKKIQ